MEGILVISLLFSLVFVGCPNTAKPVGGGLASNEYIIHFDESKVEVRTAGNWEKLSSGARLQNYVRLNFIAVNLGEDVVTKWQIGNNEQTELENPNDFWMLISKDFANQDGIINISYETKLADIYELDYDKNEISIQIYKSTEGWNPLTTNIVK